MATEKSHNGILMIKISICIVAYIVYACGVTYAGVVREYIRLDGATDVPLPGVAVITNMFGDTKTWEKPNNFRNGLDITLSDGVLVVAGTRATNKFDTAWSLTSKPLELTQKGLGYILSFGLSANPRIRRTTGKDYSCSVRWYDGGGRQIACDPFPLRSKEGVRRRIVFLGSIPLAAEKFSVQFGFDGPNLHKGDHVKFDSLSLHVMSSETDPAWGVPPEPEAPRIRIVSDSPFSDPLAELRISVSSGKTIDWSSLKIFLDGKSNKAFSRTGDILSFTPDMPWSNGLHRVDITLTDPESGDTVTVRKAFFRGCATTNTPHVALRDDGITLVDGVPFFPIGIYGLRKRGFNAFDIDRALRELAACGFNLVNSYRIGRTREFLDCAARHGMKTWTAERLPTQLFADELRFHPAILAWYVGDDTAMHLTPLEVYDRVDGIRAVDSTRITAQADVMNSGDAISSYRPFVKVTDVFMPEVYPVREELPCPTPMCVPLAIRDMKCFKRDVDEVGDGKPHAIWPIIQYFKGWRAWKRYPTRDELFAMTFATIVHGAHGITFYTYGGEIIPEKGKFNYGVTSTQEAWTNITNLAQRISALAPALLERTPPQPPPAKIVSGPAKDRLGNPSISLLLKRHGGDVYVIAVNGTVQDVAAEFDLGVCAAEAQVLWEGDRRVPIRDGLLGDAFAPLAVHIYRISN